ncbi:MAG: aminotransferase class I/II-fold pyridoxal phosphate-dependent enzyme, partial [Flavobacteriaceae bacterium]|nr:aminotransferase class I/II-fold pyridoxal phosphate-dependent enzyme [Flavobacteriaceae bacterium]
MGLNYKTYIPESSTYKGGKSKDEVGAAGMKVYKMSSNENPLGASPKALEAVKKYSASISEYPSPVDLRFRTKLSEFYQGVLSPEQFITTNSGVANIELIIRGFLDEHSECIYCSPYFNAYKDFSEMMGAKTIDVPLLGKEFALDIAGIANAITDKTSVLFITSPNNP